MKRISDEELDKKIRLANERLNKLQEKKCSPTSPTQSYRYLLREKIQCNPD